MFFYRWWRWEVNILENNKLNYCHYDTRQWIIHFYTSISWVLIYYKNDKSNPALYIQTRRHTQSCLSISARTVNDRPPTLTNTTTSQPNSHPNENLTVTSTPWKLWGTVKMSSQSPHSLIRLVSFQVKVCPQWSKNMSTLTHDKDSLYKLTWEVNILGKS